MGIFFGDTTKVTEDRRSQFNVPHSNKTDLYFIEWLPVTREDVLSNPDVDPLTVYSAEKALSEKAVWEFADAHPHVELTTGKCLAL